MSKIIGNEETRPCFQSRLSWLGYQIEQDNPIFEEVYQQYINGTLYDVVPTEWLPVMIWYDLQMKAILEPYMRIGID